jgi:hypothetical protein
MVQFEQPAAVVIGAIETLVGGALLVSGIRSWASAAVAMSSPARMRGRTMNGTDDLQATLALFARVESNLVKLEGVWNRLLELMPDGSVRRALST